MARLYTNNSIISTLSTHGVDLPTDRRKLSKAGWVRLRGARSVRGMDAAAKPPATGLRRPPQPDPPRHPSGNQLLLWLWLWLVAGAGRSPA
ncbi:hypothetical protein B9Y85_05995 [Stenotrophomonas maltophilia]|nr:hypothetical protein B9Y57_04605 [Stenotrophomonas maltophilia]PJL29801.1 hypothetical protein B9Y65_04605 [Stenotrophomonas maltophilia]PJL70050.1 hypothetical protein B9Y85_05995 [Stenotrophomonas maltophilia]